MEPAARRSAPLDIAKGIAIVCVVLIHSALFDPSFVHTHFIARAVPMFFVTSILIVVVIPYAANRRRRGPLDESGDWDTIER